MFQSIIDKIVSFFLAVLAFFGIHVGGHEPTPPPEQPEIIVEAQEEILSFEADFPTIQGMCSDGKNIYVLAYDASGNEDAKDYIYKVDTETKSIVNRFEVNAGAGTDMCYNGITNEIVIANNLPASRLTVIDTSTMLESKTVELDSLVYSICFDSANNCYYMGNSGGKHATRYSSKFERQGVIITDQKSRGHQSCELVGDYICTAASSPNSIFVFDKNGTAYGCYTLPVSKGKVAGICLHNDKLFVCYNSSKSCTIYQLNEFKGEPVSEPEMIAFMHVNDGDPIIRIQGGCCSDKYIYELQLDTTNENNSSIIKIDPQTKTIVKQSEPLFVGHGNDMYYKGDTNEVCVVHNKPNRWEVSVYDADTLEYKELLDVGHQIFGMDRDNNKNIYYASESYTRKCLILGQSFEEISSFDVVYNDATTQGIFFNDSKIFYVLYKPNCLNIYNADGSFHSTYTLPLTVGEPENGFFFNGEYYLTVNNPGNNGSVIYKCPDLSKYLTNYTVNS